MDNTLATSTIKSGFDASSFLATVPHSSGVYRMFNVAGTIIYIGKARDLKKRLSQYFLKDVASIKTKALVAHIHHIEFTVTFSESEALILECNLIKEFQPKYNILLRDDKSYPFIFVSHGTHPKVVSHRGSREQKGDYFGPYPSPSAVRESLHLLQKIFPIRQCADSVYKSRTRPCLQYQIGRCLAPCVKGMCTDEEYNEQVKLLKLFLAGKDTQVIASMIKKMEELSDNLEFEKAAIMRDRIAALRTVQEQQGVSGDSDVSIDVLGADAREGMACIHVLFIRHGKVLGTHSYFPRLPLDSSISEILLSFMEQFYLTPNKERQIPSEIICAIDEKHEKESEVLEEAISQAASKTVHVLLNVRAERARYLRLAMANAISSLTAKLEHENTLSSRTEALEELLGLTNIERMECFDISHTFGELTVASMVVFNRLGPNTKEYKRFNISGITPGDDFAAMEQALTRRFAHSEWGTPDVLFIDGGLGQLQIAEKIFTKVAQESNDSKVPLLIGVAKGEGRKEGLETLITGEEHKEINLTLDNTALQLVLHIRDEAHRFAITGHRNRRDKARVTSEVQSIPGIGPKRRQALLKYFGGKRGLTSASAEEIAKVPGVRQTLAKLIYSHLHG